jgi:WS/DGAT/MGAT family acyltransferase
MKHLSGEDLTFWWADSPVQPTTMAMLMVLDRRPDEARLRQALERTLVAVPRLRERVVDAPFDLTQPHWEPDPTFDLNYHFRRHGLTGEADLTELFHEIGPAYETPFDRSRPLWEARLYDWMRHGRAALFFKLHHAVADGIGANAIFAALTDAESGPSDLALPEETLSPPGHWPEEPGFGSRVIEAIGDRITTDIERARVVSGAVVEAIRHPTKVKTWVDTVSTVVAQTRGGRHAPLTEFGRARRMSGMELPFQAVRNLKNAIGGTMIDTILTIMARAMGRWCALHGWDDVSELTTLVPINLRRPEDWTEKAEVGNVATGLLVALPIRIVDPLETHREVHRRVEARKADPSVGATPVITEVLSALPRQVITWAAQQTSASVDFIVTNVPGILASRYLAGAEIVSAYPFAPVAMQSPASVALYGYRDSLFIGLNSDETSMPDVEAFRGMIAESFAELCEAAQRCGNGAGDARAGG